MSGVGTGSGELAEVLLRSSTPGPNEKVLGFLEGLPDIRAMSPHSRPPSEIGSMIQSTLSNQPRRRPSDWDPTSPKVTGAPHLYAPSPRNGNGNGSVPPSNLGGVQERDEDADSNVQDGLRSELGSMQGREPGPNDAPGPHYESYGSSFGNMGPLPRDSVQPPPWTTWNPPNANNGEQVMSMLSGAGATRIPLPESVVSPSEHRLGVNVDPSEGKSRSKAPSKASKRSESGAKDDDRATQVSRADNESPKPPRSRAGSRATKPGDDVKSHISRQTKGTEYPPLPMSPQGDTNVWSPASQPAKLPSRKAYSKAPSISPSDSPSNIKHFKKAPKIKTIQSEDGGTASVAAAEKRNAARSPGPASAVLSSHQSRPFSPYRHAATTENMFALAADNVGLMSPAKSLKPVSIPSTPKRSVAGDEADITPTPSRVMSPLLDMDDREAALVRDAIQSRRTSYAAPPSNLEPDVVDSHFHDMDLCILLHQMDDFQTHEVVKKALRKAVRQRVKKLGMKYDNDSIQQYRKSFHDHDPQVHMQEGYEPTIPKDMPDWAKVLMNGMNMVHERFDGLDHQIQRLKPPKRAFDEQSQFTDGDAYTQATPRTQTVNINTQPTGGESMFPVEETEIVMQSQQGTSEHDGDYDEQDEGYGQQLATNRTGDTRSRGPMSDLMSEGRDDSPGQQYLEEELYKLRIKPGGSQAATHKTWELGEVPREEQEEYDEEEQDGELTESGMPEIPDSGYTDHRATSPPLPPIPHDDQSDVVNTPQAQNKMLVANYYGEQENYVPPWQRVHQRLLSWAIVWPMNEIEHALNSTTRGQQVDEIALSIWSVQSYKRYVRSKMTESPGGRPDRLFVPPNMADAISTAVFNGRHGDACGMLRDLWGPFGLDGAPRLIIVLAKHRSDSNHWVVHRFSLPEGALTTYDSYPERTLPDGRPLGWWFAIRVAWPGAVTQSPDHLLQKMVRLHRPMQLGIDNSVAAAGIWRNILMGSRAERSLDLERLRDLINTEVKNLRQRKLQGKLSLSSAAKPNDITWEEG